MTSNDPKTLVDVSGPVPLIDGPAGGVWTAAASTLLPPLMSA
jgi:hypothetical protein